MSDTLGDLGSRLAHAARRLQLPIERVLRAANGQYEFQPGYARLNARVTWADKTGPYTVAVHGEDITDQSHCSNAQDVMLALGITSTKAGALAEFSVGEGLG